MRVRMISDRDNEVEALQERQHEIKGLCSTFSFCNQATLKRLNIRPGNAGHGHDLPRSHTLDGNLELPHLQLLLTL